MSVEVALERIAIARDEELTSLDLSSLDLRMVPGEIGQLTALTDLNLSGNRLTALPSEIGKLTALTSLYLNNNQLTALPSEIGKLAALTGLYLGYNQLTALPSEIWKLTALTALDLSDSQLTTLPSEIGKLTGLAALFLTNNQLTALPSEIGKLTALIALFLGDNQLTALPGEIAKLTALTQLTLWGNPALGLPRELVERSDDPAAILDHYLRTRKAAKPLNEVKLLLVGRGGAGKTSIVRRLREKRFDPDEPETPGISIDPWKIGRGADQVRVHVWDFAGQIITHSTHQFFLTHRSVYILVLSGREDSEREDAEYWLRMIRAFGTKRETGETSPVVVALNKCSEHPCNLDRNALKEKYPFIVAFIETDCADDTGLRQLTRVLSKTIRGMDAVRQKFPAEWWQIKDRLASMDEDYLSFDQYRELCVELGETEETAQRNLANILHALGVALNYAADARLREATILNPEWVTTGIYSLLRDAVRDDGSGEMHRTDVERVLPQEQPRMRDYLVELMRRFDLAFPLSEEGDRWLVPQRLPDEQPKLSSDWADDEATRLRYRYSALPEGLLPRFITRTYPLSENQQRWVNGVVLKADDAQALVRADRADRVVTVVVRGEPAGRRRLVGLIRTDLRTIHHDIEGLDPTEEIELEELSGEWMRVRVLEADERNRQPSSVGTDDGTVPVDTVRELDRMSAPEARDPQQWKPKLFISYASSDAKQRDELLVRLKAMQSEGLLAAWHDRCLVAGQKWDEEIRRECAEADVVVFLVSARFEASDYIQGVEVAETLKRADAGKTVIVSIVLEKCGWKKTKLAQYQVLPPKGKPVRDTKPQRDAWHIIAEELRRMLEPLRENSAKSLGPPAS